MAGQYATSTTVPVGQTREAIERVLTRYGATSFGYLTEPGQARVVFQYNGRHILFRLPLPAPDDPQFTRHQRGRRTPEAAGKLWEQACRSAWRSLLMVVQATLEAVAAGIVAEGDAFLANTMLPDGRTVAEHTQPAVAEAYARGTMDRPLLALGSGS